MSRSSRPTGSSSSTRSRGSCPACSARPTSADDESFSAGLLEYPQYTRPRRARRRSARARRCCTSGNHAAIAAWRRAAGDAAHRRRAAPICGARSAPTRADAKLVRRRSHARTHLALVHHPVVDRTGAVVTTALTNFDIHDLARSAMTYGLAGYHIVTPIDVAARQGRAHRGAVDRRTSRASIARSALALVRTAASIDDVIAELTASTARARGGRDLGPSRRRFRRPRAARRTSCSPRPRSTPRRSLILLGTGWGLADALIPSVSRVLAPIEGASDWNHLSVRSAGAVMLDRLFGRAGLTRGGISRRTLRPIGILPGFTS